MLRGKTYDSKICPQNKTIFCQHVVMQNYRSLYAPPWPGEISLFIINSHKFDDSQQKRRRGLGKPFKLMSQSLLRQRHSKKHYLGARAPLSSLSTTARWPQRRKRLLSPDHRRTASPPQISFANSASALAKNQTQRAKNDEEQQSGEQCEQIIKIKCRAVTASCLPPLEFIPRRRACPARGTVCILLFARGRVFPPLSAAVLLLL